MRLHTSCSELCERTADVILSEGHYLRHPMRLQNRVRKLPPGAIFRTNQKAVTPWTRFNVAYLLELVFAQCIRG
ncbi:hypothetical protein ACSQ5K_21915 [Pseudomonas sp. PhalM4]